MEFFASVGLFLTITALLAVGACTQDARRDEECRKNKPVIIDGEVYRCSKEVRP